VIEGSLMKGVQTITAAAPYERMPLFVRAGSIVPTSPAIQFTGNNTHSPLTVNVSTGADGSFSLYEDDGVTRQYLNGKHSRIPFAWNERTKTHHQRARGQLFGHGGQADDQGALGAARTATQLRRC
jgi:alpha-D-xyloside xylohydrolase